MYKFMWKVTHASWTLAGCQLSEPTLSAKASIPFACAKLMSAVHVSIVYGKVFPTMWWATTSFGFSLLARALSGVGRAFDSEARRPSENIVRSMDSMVGRLV